MREWANAGWQMRDWANAGLGKCGIGEMRDCEKINNRLLIFINKYK